MQISAYVPCFDNAASVRRAVQSLLDQTVPPHEVFVVDDGSTDGSVESLRGMPIRIVRHEKNLGRGAARGRAMAEARGALVLCCDATLALPADFTARALARMDRPGVASVHGRVVQSPGGNFVRRWRGRHLFKTGRPLSPNDQAPLALGGALLLRTAVAEAGGFNMALRQGEDGDLGRRLLDRNLRVVFDPSLEIFSILDNTLGEVLERYWRWHAAEDNAVTWRAYRRNLGYAVKSMATADIRARDPLAAAVSLIVPHYQFWRSLLRRAKSDQS